MKKIIAALVSLIIAGGMMMSISGCGPSHKTPSDRGTQSDSTRMQNGNTDTSMMSTDTSHHRPGRR